MKHLFFVVSFFMSLAAQAHCPNEVVTAQGKYCYDLEWQSGDKKIKGVLQTTSEVSPHLNAQGSLPNSWIYSRALVRVWQEGDKNHVPVELENFRIFPYMMMSSGHHHPASSDFIYDAAAGAYTLSNFALQQMDGCWTLRMSTDGSQDEATSQPSLTITQYANLSDEENKLEASLCTELPPPAQGGGHHHH